MLEDISYTIAYQGATGAFSHMAAQKFASSLLKHASVRFMACRSFEETMHHCRKDKNTLACLPFENSSVGTISENYELLWNLPLHIIAELNLPVHHQLLALPGTKMMDLQEVFSHPVALDQCKKFFHKNPQLQAQVYFDTAAAAKLIQNEHRKNAAAIAPASAAAEYALEIIQNNIEDYEANQTRFLLLSANETFSRADSILSLPYKVTSGFEAEEDLNHLAELALFLSEDFRLVKVQTIPEPERPFKVHTFLDFLVNSEKGKLIADHFVQSMPTCRFFGRYQTLTGSD